MSAVCCSSNVAKSFAYFGTKTIIYGSSFGYVSISYGCSFANFTFTIIISFLPYRCVFHKRNQRYRVHNQPKHPRISTTILITTLRDRSLKTYRGPVPMSPKKLWEFENDIPTVLINHISYCKVRLRGFNHRVHCYMW